MEDSTLIFSQIPLKTIVSLVFYLLFGLFAVFTAVIYYHWETYATDAAVSRFTLLTYMIMSLPLLLIMGVLLFVI